MQTQGDAELEQIVNEKNVLEIENARLKQTLKDYEVRFAKLEQNDKEKTIHIAKLDNEIKEIKQSSVNTTSTEIENSNDTPEQIDLQRCFSIRYIRYYFKFRYI
ncbi:13307_t:CDS:1 [Racocetra fulgida]|uniref:13307_t:CDS:1 n=1 Tax=Racocetra fulgida TaxID=60492 RepID=A0A9N8W7E2_9GLOM|nr:13307_t:CDS:1 [Racocetra fulgida]